MVVFSLFLFYSCTHECEVFLLALELDFCREEEFINNFNSNVVDSIYTFSVLKFQICSSPPLNNI